MLIERFRHKGLRRLYDDDDPRGLPPGSVRKIKAILAALEAAADLSEVETMPGWKLHPLKGDRRGEYWDHGDRQPADHLLAAWQCHHGRRLRGLPLGRALTMPMKNLPHPGEVVREEVLQPLGLSLTKAAEILGVRRATLSDLTNGKTALSAEMALRLEKAFGVSMELLLRMQAGYDAARARRRAAEIDVRRYRPDVAPAID